MRDFGDRWIMHNTIDLTTLYSAVELQELVTAADKIVDRGTA